MTKQALRDMMIELRNHQSIDDKKTKDQSIIKKIKQHHQFKDAHVVSIFYPMKNEINLLELLNEDKHFLFPRVHKDQMEFYIYHKDMKWEKSKFGVYEPSNNEQMYQGKIDFMIVPALAISKDNSRVGYGKGFYDKYIDTHDIAYTLGVIYDFQEVEKIETTSFDQQLDEYIKGSL